MDLLQGKQRTKMCGQFSEQDINTNIIAMGWASNVRDFGGLIFIDLRDKSGVLQVVINQELYKHDYSKITKIRHEYVLAVQGKIIKRDSETINPKISTGTIEVMASEVFILSESEPLPFEISDDVHINEALRLKYRYLDLRRDSLQQVLRLRNQIYKTTRSYLDSLEFTEIETPILGKSTPEGARDYLVPSRTFAGSFFALPQSPQLYKQLLMVAGVDKYFQIAKCFRDEDLRADRQPEFTQIDLELSFVDNEHTVIQLTEGLLQQIFKDTIGYKLPDKFKQITYKDAMERYGSDKPDTRFDLNITDISEIINKSSMQLFKEIIADGGSVRAINVKGQYPNFPRRELDHLPNVVKDFGAKGVSWIAVTTEGIKGGFNKYFEPQVLAELLAKLDAKPDDVLLLMADYDNETVLTAMGKLRLYLAERFNLIKTDEYDVLWVTDFPLFEYSATQKRLVAKHHPFTSPKDQDLELMLTKPLNVRAKAYDVVINGYEVGGGSLRIYNQQIQQTMFKVLGFTEQDIQEKFGFFVNAFKYGTPPHGGLALGLDRLVMLLTKTSDIRSVIAFPKIQTAMDLMTLAPAGVESEQLSDLSIDIVKPINE